MIFRSDHEEALKQDFKDEVMDPDLVDPALKNTYSKLAPLRYVSWFGTCQRTDLLFRSAVHFDSESPLTMLNFSNLPGVKDAEFAQ